MLNHKKVRQRASRAERATRNAPVWAVIFALFDTMGWRDCL